MRRHLRRPLLKYMGSKFTLAKHYPEPLYDTIAESHAGGAGYAHRYPWKRIVLCELNPAIANCLKWLISATLDEIMSLPVELPVGSDIRELNISDGAKELIRRWQRVGRNDCWTISKWNGLPGQWAESVKESICESLPLIRHWEVLCGSYADLPNNEPVTTFVDAPYQYVKAYDKEFERIDYGHLGNWCQERNGQVIVCEQHGADWLPFRDFRKLTCCKNRGKQNTHQSREVIWTKGCDGTL